MRRCTMETTALDSGFNHRASLHNSFRRFVRATPPEFRKQERQRIEETENIPG